MVENWGSLQPHKRLGFAARCVGVLLEMGTSVNCSPQLEGAGIFQPGVYRGIKTNQFGIKFFFWL